MDNGSTDEQRQRERECVHRNSGRPGAYYSGASYISHLQRLRSGAALKFASRVTPFFWSDAPRIVVWLCDDCASELELIAA